MNIYLKNNIDVLKSHYKISARLLKYNIKLADNEYFYFNNIRFRVVDAVNVYGANTNFINIRFKIEDLESQIIIELIELLFNTEIVFERKDSIQNA